MKKPTATTTTTTTEIYFKLRPKNIYKKVVYEKDSEAKTEPEKEETEEEDKTTSAENRAQIKNEIKKAGEKKALKIFTI